MASVMLGDLDDFIAPGQACMNPLFTAPDAKKDEPADAGGAKMQLMLEDDGMGMVDAMQVEEAKPDLIKATGNQTAKVSLDDCLACSGCVTSAETVLITQQSTTKLLEATKSQRYAVVVASISPQARASLAERFGLTPLETQARLLNFLRGEGVDYLIDASIAADFSLLEAGEEFVQRYRRGSVEGVRPPWAAPPHTVPLSSTRRFNVEAGREEATSNEFALAAGKRDTGSAPGWSSTAGAGIAEKVFNGSNAGERPALAGSNIESVREAAADACVGNAVPRGSGELLVLTSACPGWVCYAEKTAPEALPCMSTVKSPQQVMGALAKCVFPQAWGLSSSTPSSNGSTPLDNDGVGARTSNKGVPRGVFHVAIAQCYDKKLEASRKDFRHDGGGLATSGEEFQEVDLVLTTAEVLELIEERARMRAASNGGNLAVGFTVGNTGTSNTSPSSGVAEDTSMGDVEALSNAPVDVARVFFRSNPPADLAYPLGPGLPVGQAAVSADGLSLFGGVDGEGAAGGNSGGYLEYVFRYAALRLFGRELAGQPLVYREGRNPDFRETSLEVNGNVVLRFAYAYGFRNIQSILAKARRGKCPYHFVEVMACPSGCINGGGQIKSKKEAPGDTRRRVESVAEVLRKNRIPRAPHDNPLLQTVYMKLLGGVPGGTGARPFLHTTYHNVPKLELSNPLMSPW